jgi:hypothetical protein
MCSLCDIFGYLLQGSVMLSTPWSVSRKTNILKTYIMVLPESFSLLITVILFYFRSGT